MSVLLASGSEYVHAQLWQIYVSDKCDFFPIHGNDTFNHIYFHVVVERSQQGKAAQELLCMITQYDLWCLIH